MSYPPYGSSDPYGQGGYGQGQPGQQPQYGPPQPPPQQYGPQQYGPPQDGAPGPGQYGYGAPGYPPPAPPRKSRTGLILGLTIGGVLLLVCGVVGAFVVLPRLTGAGDKTPAGAKAAAQKAIDLVSSGDYGGFYDMTDAAFRRGVSRSDFITIGNCLKMADEVKKQNVIVGSATVTGNIARVAATSDGSDDHIDLVWESNGWHLTTGAKGTMSASQVNQALQMCKK